jgi:hypothetical protein
LSDEYEPFDDHPHAPIRRSRVPEAITLAYVELGKFFDTPQGKLIEKDLELFGMYRHRHQHLDAQHLAWSEGKRAFLLHIKEMTKRA